MKQFFSRNIDWRGRIVRALVGLALLGVAFYSRTDWPPLAVGLAIAGSFSLLQAVRGWCLARACGFHTKI